jgi:hypothetical protein
VASLPMYEFEGYTFRPAAWADLPLAQQWNRNDPEHTWEVQYPHYWIEQSEGVNSYALEDAFGVVFFVKSIRQADREIEITMQFDRTHETVSKVRTMAGLEAGFAWLKEALPMNGFKSVSFRSENERLILYAKKRFRFTRDGMRLVHKFASAIQHA